MIQLVDLFVKHFKALPDQVQIEVTRLFLSGMKQDHTYITKILPLDLMHLEFLKKFLNTFEEILQGFKGNEVVPQSGEIKSMFPRIADIERFHTAAVAEYKNVQSMDEVLKLCGGK